MMKLQPIQYSFSSGEITPRLYGNTQTEVYRTGVAELYNMVARAHGPAVSRSGSFYVDEAKDSNNVRIIPFNVARGEDFFLEFGPLYLRIYNRDGRIDLAGQQLIIDPSYIDEFLFWTDKSTGSGTVTFLHDIKAVSLDNGSGSNVARIGQKTRTIEAANVGQPHTFSGSFSGDGILQILIGTTDGASDVLNASVNVIGDFSFNFTPATNTNWITLVNSGGNGTSAVAYTSHFHATGSFVEITTTYLAADLPDIQFEMISSQNTLILAHSSHPPKQLVLTLPLDFQLSDIVFTAQPANWVAGNYPAVVTIFQSRLWLSRTPNSLQTIWASQSGDYYNFDKGTALANESIQIDLAASGEIEWMRGQKELMMGTDLGESKITSQNGILTPSDIDIRQQSAYGSASLLQGQNIGDQILYVSPDHKKVRALTFDEFQQGWYSPDLTWIAEHITKSGIKEIHYARDPDTLVLCLLNNGKVAACTYDRSQKSLGWSLFEFTNMPIISMAVINGDLGSTIVGAGKQSNGKLVLLIDAGTFDVRAELDSTITRPVEAGNIITGLGHLEGLTVGIHVDHALHPDKVVTGGQITLDYAGTNAAVGLRYTSRLKTLPLDVGSTQGSGSGNMKHWAKIYVRVVDSSIPKINGTRPATRQPATPMNQVEPNTTEDIQVTDIGRTRKAQITIEQDLPLKLEVLNLFGIVGQDLL